MRATLKAIPLLCALAAAAAAAQGGEERRGAPGLEVSAFEWKYGGYAPVEVVRSGKSGVELKVKRGTEYVFKYEARLTVRNTGEKSVKSVEWAHVFYDAATGKELKRYRLQLRQRVAAGETLTLLCSSACDREARCHRSLLRELIEREVKRFTDPTDPA